MLPADIILNILIGLYRTHQTTAPQHKLVDIMHALVKCILKEQ